jgi:DNA polymerase III sliding clamp (beta) subunit (PCNA family)
MRVELPVDTLRDVLAPVNALVNEAVVSTSQDALVVHATTEGRAANVTVTLPANALKRLIPSEQAVGIKVTRTVELLTCLATSGRVWLTMPPHSTRVSLSTHDSRYQADAIDPATIYTQSDSSTAEPLPASFTLPSASTNLVHALTAADLCTDSITIHPPHFDSTVRFTATGDTESMTVLLTPTTSQSANIASPSATYPIDSVRRMYDGVSSRTDTLQFQIDHPTNRLHIIAHHTDTDATTHYTLSSLRDSPQNP